MSAEAKPVEGAGTSGLSNRNVVGMEIIAQNDRDVTPAQVQALKEFAAARYPNTPFYGHGEVNRHKEATEGQTGVQEILDARVAAGFPAPAPGATGTTPPPGFFDPITGVRGPAAPAKFGGGFGESGEFGGQLPSPGAFTSYPGWRESPNVEIHGDNDAQQGRNELAQLQTRGFGYDPNTLPEPASTPLSRDLGLLDRQGGGEIEGEAGRGGMVGRSATFDQQGPTQPGWQSSLGRDFARPELQQYSMPDTLAALERLRQRHGIPPEAVINIAGVEGSRWDPRYHSLGSSGIFQMNPPDFQEDGRSRPLGGLTFDEYANRATPAQQVDAYSDYIANSRNYPALDYAAGSNDPALYSALLQAMQFSPMRTTWAEELAAGNTSFPTHYNPPRAATELRPTSVDAMREAFARRIAAFPPSGALPGGR